MKKKDTLRLSGADYSTFYLEGEKDAAHVLKIRKGYTLQDLKHDCDAGAEQLRPLYREIAVRHGKLPTRAAFVADDEESGYLAIEAYASILLSGKSGDAVKDALYDFGIDEPDWMDRDDTSFQEYDDQIAVVDYDEVQDRERDDFGKRYWWEGLRGMVCLRSYDANNFFMLDAGSAERFSNCAMLFLLIIRDKNHDTGPEMLFDLSAQEGGEEVDDDGNILTLHSSRSLLCGFVLNNRAPVIQVAADEEQMKTFYEQVFSAKARECGAALSKDCDLSYIVELVRSIHVGLKSGIMQSAIQFVQQNAKTEEPFTTKDFDVLLQFCLPGTKPGGKKEDTDAFEVMRRKMVCQEGAVQQLEDLVLGLEADRKRKALGLHVGTPHNVLMFAGPSGTGKTTMARCLAKALAQRGLVKDSSFLSISGARLKGQYVGQTAHQVHDIFSRYSVIFIDEAYSLISKDSFDSGDLFAKEALAQLAVELENNSEGKCVIFAGYGAGSNTRQKDNLMKAFIAANPGIESRIAETVCFADYTPDEMIRIFHRIAENGSWTIEGDIDESLRTYFTLRRKDPTFGNGREARLVLEHSMMYAAERLSSLSRRELTKKKASTLIKEDIGHAIGELTEGFVQQKSGSVAGASKRYGFIA